MFNKNLLIPLKHGKPLLTYTSVSNIPVKTLMSALLPGIYYVSFDYHNNELVRNPCFIKTQKIIELLFTIVIEKPKYRASNNKSYTTNIKPGFNTYFVQPDYKETVTSNIDNLKVF